jgi:hypothetical protein
MNYSNKPTRRPSKRVLWGCGLLFLSLLIGFVSARYRAIESTYSYSCSNQLLSIGKSLRKYLETHGTFPSAYLCSDQEKAVNSWRAAIMPDLLHNFPYGPINSDPGDPSYDLSEPWNGPHNTQLHLDKVPYSFMQCPSETQQSPAITNYIAVVGPGTMWTGCEPVKPSADGSDDEKILVIEVIDSDILWIEPRDLTLEEALDSLHATKGTRIGSHHPDGIHYVTVGGTVRTLDPNIDRESLRKLLTRDSSAAPKSDHQP